MKNILSISALLLSIVIFMGCEKETGILAKFENPGSEQAFLKINYVSAYAGNPGVQLKINENRVSNLLTARTPFPGGGFNTGGGSTNDYLAVSGGDMSIKVAVPNRNASSDSIVLFNSKLNLSAGKYYSAHITDTGANTKLVLLEDNRTLPDTGRSRYRFVNLMPNVPAIDLYYGTTVVASNIAYLSSSPYFDVIRTPTSLAWTTREAGASPTSAAIATYTSGNTTLDQRVYTIFASGYKLVPPMTAAMLGPARAAFVAFYLVN